MRWSFAEVSTIVLIALLSLLDAALYSGVFRGYDPDAAGATETYLPPASAARSAAERAEQDDSADLPGVFVPTQGRKHTADYPHHDRVPFCLDGEPHDDCYASNPPTSGLHLPTARGVVIGPGVAIDLPPDPGVYAFEIPRESIPHLQEHAGVFLGYNCASDACRAAVTSAESIVRHELTLGARVVMAPDSDLPPDTIALASWTRFDSFAAGEYTDHQVRRFIQVHSCRFDPEGFCMQAPHT